VGECNAALFTGHEVCAVSGLSLAAIYLLREIVKSSSKESFSYTISCL
jgi:hypothetical protein